MDYIVFDLEWNQSPGGKEDSVAHLPFEIIEIGAVKLDESFRQIGEFHRLIRPKVYPQLHYKISEITHMEMAELKRQGQDFKQAVKEFMDWCGKDYRFFTWGSMDLTELERNMDYYHVPIPFPKPALYYDVQKLYGLQCGDSSLRPSLDQAVQEQGLGCDRPFHRALDDAYYTGRILAGMDFEQARPYLSVDYYRLPGAPGEELYLRFPDYSKFVSRVFPSKEEALKDKVVTDMLCPFCRRMLSKKVRWFPYGQRLCYGLADCPEHGLLRGKMRVRKSEYGGTYVIKTMKPATQEEAALMLEKREEERVRRNNRNHSRKENQQQRRRKQFPKQQ